MNTITVSGNVGQSPELRFTSANMAVLEFTVASTSGRDDKKKTSWFNIVCFGRTAENVAKSVQKGDSVIVVGKIEQEEYTKKDGTKGKSVRLVADEVGTSCRWNAWVKDRTDEVVRSVAKAFTDDEEIF